MFAVALVLFVLMILAWAVLPSGSPRGPSD